MPSSWVRSGVRRRLAAISQLAYRRPFPRFGCSSTFGPASARAFSSSTRTASARVNFGPDISVGICSVYRYRAA